MEENNVNNNDEQENMIKKNKRAYLKNDNLSMKIRIEEEDRGKGAEDDISMKSLLFEPGNV